MYIYIYLYIYMYIIYLHLYVNTIECEKRLIIEKGHTKVFIFHQRRCLH